MGALKRGRGRRKGRLRNLNLRASYVLYMLAGLIVAVAGCSLSINLLDAARMNIYYRYQSMAQEYPVPQGGRVETLYGETSSYVVYDQDGSVTLRLTPSPREKVEAYAGASGINRLVVTLGYSQEDSRKDLAIGLAMTAMFPLWFIGGAVACAGLFYRNKLRRPLALLTQAAQRIAREDLDFSIAYDRRDEMGALCDAFEAMRLSLSQNNARMWRAMEERKKVNGAFAHDIRTPLTVIKGYAQLLDKQLAAQAAPEVTRPMVATISRQLARLEDFTQAMSQLTRLDEMPFHPRPLTLSAFLPQLTESAAPLCRERGLAFSFSQGDMPPQMCLDRALICQVFDNLLSNAVGYGRTQVRARAWACRGDFFLSVENDGAPFTSEQLERATAPYYTSGAPGHLGLGLHICQALCEKHGGGLLLTNPTAGGARTIARFRAPLA